MFKQIKKKLHQKTTELTENVFISMHCYHIFVKSRVVENLIKIKVITGNMLNTLVKFYTRL